MIFKPGDILNERYLIINPIGQGGMGSIYLAEDQRLDGRKCAMKVIKGDPDATEESIEQTREQFFREASVLARLDHKNLPKVSDYFATEDSDILVMDYVPGKDLKDLIDEAMENDEHLKQADVLSWAEQILDALDYLHSQEQAILHRDIKPSNLKLTPDGIIKLVDFGLVKLMAPDERTVTVVQGRGSVSYTPLEQYGGDTGHTDGRSDLYSFGATLYHLLTNKTPLEAKLRFINMERLPMVREINKKVSERVERAIHWLLNLHPDERPADVHIAREALFNGVFPDPEGRPIFIPENPGEWVLRAFSDPLQRILMVVAGLLMIIALVVTFLPSGV